MHEPCSHGDSIADVSAPRDVCEACVEIGSTWVHLRQCLTCGRTLCCDDSPNRHMSAHWRETGHPVITPGSMGTYSAIQVGLPGAAASFYSINHGAGRVMSRAAARRTLDQGQVDAEMAAMDILVNHRHTPLDEAPAVYKNMDDVLRAVRACDLAAVVAKAYPIGSMKGHDEPRGAHGKKRRK